MMDTQEEAKIRTYCSLATILMAIIAISYCANLPVLRIQTNSSEIPPAPGAASASISDVIFEDRKKMFKPFLLGAIGVTACLFSIINSRWRTYMPGQVVLSNTRQRFYPARVSHDDRLNQAIVLVMSHGLLMLSFTSVLNSIQGKMMDALIHIGANVLLFLLLSIFIPLAILAYTGFVVFH